MSIHEENPDNIEEIAGDAADAAFIVGTEYFPAAIRYIDQEFGQGYAMKNPALVGVFLQACCAVYKLSE